MRKELSSEICTVRCSIEWYEDCLRKADSHINNVRERSELGSRFQHRTFRNFDRSQNERAFDKAAQYANHFDEIRNTEKNSIIFSGDTGTGKTHLAAAISNHVINKNRCPVMFGTFIEYLDRIRSEFKNNTDQTKHDMKTVPLLIIDDLGKEKQTAWSDQTLFEIINYRYEHGLPVVITTNLSWQALSKQYDRAVISRLAEVCVSVNVVGQDHRL